MRISDWSSDVCSSDLAQLAQRQVDIVLDEDAVFGFETQRLGKPQERPAGVVHVGLRLHQQQRFAVQAGVCQQDKIGRASCRARVGKYGYIAWVAESFKKKK